MTQPFSYSGNKGSGDRKSETRQQQGKPPVAVALRRIINFNAADNNQYCRSLGGILERGQFLFR